MPNNKKNIKTRMRSVEETNAALEKEFAEQNPKAGDLPLEHGESKALDESLQSSSVVAEETVETVSDGSTMAYGTKPPK
jgi:hypothetical protein